MLWNLLLDSLLKGLEERNDYCQAFADDVVLVFVGDTSLQIQEQANAALAYVQEWGVKNKLKFAPQKTKAMIITRKLKFDTPLLKMGGVDIEMSEEIKILGVHIDNKLTFNNHAAQVCKKALNIFKKLATAAKVSWGLHPEVIRTIYTATVEPVILYAASVWARETKKLIVRKHLDTVQRGFAQKLTKAYRTVSLSSALVLAGLLPLDLRIQEAAALYEAKRGVPLPVLADRELEKMVCYTKNPHPADCMSLEYIDLIDQEAVDRHKHQDVKIYTDGSKLEGKVGAALSIWGGEAETKALKLKLSQYCTVYQAELLALCRATVEVLKRQEKTFGIYCDSKAALETVINPGCVHTLAVEARKNLREALTQQKQVCLFWIKAHAGLEGNERADQLAKDAALKIKRKPDYDRCPKSFARRQIRLETLARWNDRYKTGDTASITKIFHPDAIEAYKTVRQTEPTSIMTQIMTGHGGFSEYLTRFKCKENPSCICEPGVSETVPHILFECPANGLVRYEAEQELECEITMENASTLIADKKKRGRFMEFCKEVAERAIKRNKDK